jgi:hypothetical protein
MVVFCMPSSAIECMVASISCCLRVSLTPTFGMAASVTRLVSDVEKQHQSALLFIN